MFIILLYKCKTYHKPEGSLTRIDEELYYRHCNSDCLKERRHMLARTLQLFAVPDTI